MTDIVAFPPAGIMSYRLRVDRPVRRSAYALDGKRAVSGAGPGRRAVDLTVSALSRHGAGAGYLDALWERIDGGIGLVRFSIPPINWHLDLIEMERQIGNRPIAWEHDGAPLSWEHDGAPLYWFAKTVRFGTVTTLSGGPALEVTGLPPDIIVARPGDIVRVYADDGTDEGAARVLDLTRSDASGVAVVPLSEALPAGVVAFADEESAVFEVTQYDPQAQQVGRNWMVNVGLREVLASEISDPVEVNPWR